MFLWHQRAGEDQPQRGKPQRFCGGRAEGGCLPGGAEARHVLHGRRGREAVIESRQVMRPAFLRAAKFTPG